MSLMSLYQEMSDEDKASLGKGSSKINVSGCHLVTVGSLMVIDDSRVKAEFKNASGQTAEWVGFLTSKDPSKQEAVTSRVMGVIKQLCIAAGLSMEKVLAKSTIGSVTYKSGSVPTEEYPLLKGKKLYITTTTELEADQKDANKVWLHQVIDPYKFFDTKKRNGLEISSEADEGTTMEAADAEAKTKVEISWQSRSNAACVAKLAQMQSGVVTDTAAGSTDEIADDDI